jgi:hypothetical protein
LVEVDAEDLLGAFLAIGRVHAPDIFVGIGIVGPEAHIALERTVALGMSRGAELVPAGDAEPFEV